MHWLGRGLCICGIALCVASCAQDKKLPEGVRVSVLDDETPALATSTKNLSGFRSQALMHHGRRPALTPDISSVT